MPRGRAPAGWHLLRRASPLRHRCPARPRPLDEPDDEQHKADDEQQAAEEPDGERTYHLELGPVTAHFFQEEWEEFIDLIRDAAQEPSSPDEEEGVEVELDWGSLYFSRDEWQEFQSLINQLG